METEYNYYGIREGIYYLIHKPAAILDLEYAKRVTAERLRITGGRDIPVLGDVRAVTSGVTRDARRYLAGEGLQSITAIASVVGSPFTRVLVNFYTGVNRPPIPNRIFTDVDSAHAWLCGFVEPAEHQGR